MALIPIDVTETSMDKTRFVDCKNNRKLGFEKTFISDLIKSLGMKMLFMCHKNSFSYESSIFIRYKKFEYNSRHKKSIYIKSSNLKTLKTLKSYLNNFN